MTYQIDQSEIDDFVKFCRARGIDENDFTINGCDLMDVVKKQLSGKLILKNSVATKDYQPSEFPSQCSIDVEHGFFG
jgi:hypothetical protein